MKLIYSLLFTIAGFSSNQSNAEKIGSYSCLGGWANCRPVIVEFEHRKAQESKSKSRTLIFSHGSGGVDTSVSYQEAYWRERGYDTLVLYHWRSRGIQSTHFDYAKASLEGANSRSQAVDVYAAIQWLESQGVQPKDIGVIGFSQGAIVGHWMDSPEFRRAVASRWLGYSTNPAFVIGLYGCSGEFNRNFTTSLLPFYIVIGDKDYLFDGCVMYRDLKTRINPNTSLHVLRGQYHTFDADYSARWFPNQNTGKCFAILDSQQRFSLPLLSEISQDRVPSAHAERLKLCATNGETAGHSGDRSIGQPVIQSILEYHWK